MQLFEDLLNLEVVIHKPCGQFFWTFLTHPLCIDMDIWQPPHPWLVHKVSIALYQLICLFKLFKIKG